MLIHKKGCSKEFTELMNRNNEIREDYRGRLRASAEKHRVLKEEMSKATTKISALETEVSESKRMLVSGMKDMKRDMRKLQRKVLTQQITIRALQSAPRQVTNIHNHHDNSNTLNLTINNLILQGPVADITAATIAAVGHLLEEKHLMEGVPGLVTFMQDAKLLVKVENLETMNYYRTDKARKKFKLHGADGVVLEDIQAAMIRQAIHESNIIGQYVLPMADRIVASAHATRSPSDALYITGKMNERCEAFKHLEEPYVQKQLLDKITAISTPVRNLRERRSVNSARVVAELEFIDSPAGKEE